MPIKNDRCNEKGIGLVETIVALGISMIVLTSLVSLSLYTLRSSQQSKYMLEASKLATEELERVRAVRDNSTTAWSDFKTAALVCTGGHPCLVSPTVTLLSISHTTVLTPDPENGNYIRYFTVTEPSSDILRISVTVSYTIGGQTKSVHNYTDLTNWRNN